MSFVRMKPFLPDVDAKGSYWAVGTKDPKVESDIVFVFLSESYEFVLFILIEFKVTGRNI